MPALVRFDDHVAVEVVVSGRLLPLQLPDGLRVHRVRTGDRIELTLVSDRSTSKFVGRLDIPFVGRGGDIQVAHLDVPPPSPWRWGDIRAMYASAERLRLPDPAGTTGLQEAQDVQRLPGERIAWRALTRCSASARRALVRWPSRTEARVVRAPLEQARGIELIDATEAGLGLSIDLLKSGGRIAPEVTARKVRSSVPWTNRTLSAVATRVATSLDQAERSGVVGEVPASLTAPIRSMAHLARPAAPVSDPPLSSWPPQFVDAYVACLDVLSHLSHGGRTSGWVPLSDLWRLYELWLAERVLAILVRLLGAPSTFNGDAEERIAATWTGPGWELVLRHPCVFSSKQRSIVGAQWWSVSSRLDPDVALLARSAAGVRCVLLDAKDRPRLTQGDVAVEASKYQWGIRRDDVTLFGVDAVILASPFGGDEAFNRAHARHWAWHAHPNAPQGQPRGAIGTDISSTRIRALLVEQLSLPPETFPA